MTPDWTLAADDVREGQRPRVQQCPTCRLVYWRVKFDRITPDPCPVCRLVALRREELAREVTCR